MNFRVRLFAVARQLAGCDAVDVELPATATVADLRHQLAETVPELAAAMPQMMFALDAQYATDAARLAEAAEIACIPPVSGG